jgi:glutamate-1-semialdehyde 2,1-aminomutase
MRTDAYMPVDLSLYAIGFLFLLYVVTRCYTRLQLSLAKHPSLKGHSKWARRVAKLIPFFEYSGDQFFSSDGAPLSVAIQRRESFEKLGEKIKATAPQSIELYGSLDDCISDVHFTNAYRVPYPYRQYVQQHIKLGPIVTGSLGVRVKDLDGNWSIDLSGSYGVNVFGYDFYKSTMDKGFERVKDLGPVLGPYHPLIKDIVDELKDISGLDEVSFHMSGTEAVMQAVRLARYHTGRSHLVRLCGAYHGWWDGVQPGIGNQRRTNDVYTLTDMSEQTLKVLRSRKDIACVLINPLQGLHPNADASSDASLLNSERSASFDKQAYSAWLKQVREVCIEREIVLIFDEVFTGFRLAHRGAQAYFGVQADLVTYGKTLGGGLPVGVLCGRHDLMKRFKDKAPVNVSFARGTFNSHPYVLASMYEFLQAIKVDDIQYSYQTLDKVWNARVNRLNMSLEQADIPVKLANLTSIITVLYTQPSRYNWMFQYYLKNEGLALSWVGTGRLIMSHNFTDEEFDEVIKRFINAAIRMKKAGWWWQCPELTNKWIKRQILKDMLSATLLKTKLIGTVHK